MLVFVGAVMKDIFQEKIRLMPNEYIVYTKVGSDPGVSWRQYFLL
jgi:hypothetical protein